MTISHSVSPIVVYVIPGLQILVRIPSGARVLAFRWTTMLRSSGRRVRSRRAARLWCGA